MKRPKPVKFVPGIILALSAALIVGAPVLADDSMEGLKRQVDALQKRVSELEMERANPSSAASGTRIPGIARRWDPFEEMRRMQQQMDRMFQDSFTWSGPTSRGMFGSNMFYDDNVNIKEDKDKYTIEFDMTGLNQEKIDLEVNQDSVTVRGEHAAETTEEDEGAYFRSKTYGTFIRTIPLPKDADTSMVKTESENDTLIITIAKKKS